MSTYLERNADLIAEINGEVRRGLRFDQVYRAESDSGTKYFTVGEYPSGVLGRTLFLGIKERKRLGKNRVAMDLGIARTIADRIPQFEPELPAFIGLLEENGIEKGEIVEDVSDAWQKSVEEMPMAYGEVNHLFPFELQHLNLNLTKEALANTSFLIGTGRQRKILDLVGLLHGMDPHEIDEIFSPFSIFETMDRHTVHTR